MRDGGRGRRCCLAGVAVLAGLGLGSGTGRGPAAVSQAGARAGAPALVAAMPKDGALLPQAPHAVRLTFAAPLDPRRTHVEVVSDAMLLVNGASVVTGAQHDTLLTPLHRLPPGPYVVVWTTAAPDGATVRRSYLFDVAPLGPPIVPDRPVSLARRVGDLVVRLAVPSNRVGRQPYAITVTQAGHPVGGAAVTLMGRSLDMDMGEARATLHDVGSGRYEGAGDVVMAGDWQLTVAIGRGRTVVHTTFIYQHTTKQRAAHG